MRRPYSFKERDRMNCISSILLSGRKTQGVALAILLAAGALGFPMVGASAEAEGDTMFNIGFSNHLFTKAKKADALASVKVWGDAILSSRKIEMDSTPVIYEDAGEIKAALLAEEVDFVAMRSEEFFRVSSEVALDSLHFASVQGDSAEEYVLLVRCDSEVETLAELQGKTFLFSSACQFCLGRLWLETLLMKQGISGLDGFFESIESSPKTSRAIMGVFFGKADACLAPRSGFETMVELNPQIGKTLKALKTSPGFIPAVMCMRESFESPVKTELLAAIRGMDKNPSGKQVLTIFGYDALAIGDIEDLAATREWFDLHALLKKQFLQTESLKVGALK